MVPIKDLQTYINGMEKSIVDKLWWLDYMPKDITTVYDFGCADGALLSAVNLIRPELNLIGYDCNPAMVMAAQTRLPQASFTSAPLVTVPENTVVVVSSVLHEIFSYREHLEDDMQAIFNCGAKYIAIRDMFFNEPVIHNYYYEEVMENVMKVIAHEPVEKIAQFEEIWGPLYDNKNLTHYLLKYRYNENWEREVHENQFAFNYSALGGIQTKSKYQISYCEYYTLPFVKQKVKEDFGIDLRASTHMKLLLER